MPIIRFDMKLTEEESALLKKRAKAEGTTQSDYLRVCMLTDSFFAGDQDAIRIMRGRLGHLVREKLSAWLPGPVVKRTA